MQMIRLPNRQHELDHKISGRHDLSALKDLDHEVGIDLFVRVVQVFATVLCVRRFDKPEVGMD